MSWIILVPFLAFGINLLLLLSLIRSLKETVAGRIFAAILLVSAAAAFSSWMIHIGAPPSPRFWLVTMLAFSVVYSPLMVHLATEYPRHKPRMNWLVLLWYGIAFIFEVANMLGKFVDQAELVPASGGMVNIKFAPTIFFAWPYMVLTILIVAALFGYSYRSSNSRAEKILLRYPLVGTVIMFGGGLLNVSPTLRSYPVEFLANLAFALVVAYAISRHQFLNIRILFRRSLGYVISILILSALFIFMFRLVQKYGGEVSVFFLWMMMVPIAGVFVFALYGMKGWLQLRIDRLFFGERYDYRQTLLEFSQKMGTTLDLDKLAEDLLSMLRSSLNCGKASLVLFSSQRGVFQVASSQGFDDETLIRGLSIPDTNPFLKALVVSGRPLSKLEIEIMAGPSNLPTNEAHWTAILDYERASALMSRGKAVGIIVLGGKSSGEQYSDEDLLLISTISHQVAVTLENASLYAESQRAYIELRQTQNNLTRSEKLRALGQMAGGVAHDFNNILGTILTRAELALDKIGDSRARADLEVIQRTTLDGAQVTQRIQEFARPQLLSEVEPINVNDLVTSTLSMIEHRLAELQQTRGLLLEVVQDLRSTNSVLGNTPDLRQALFNIMMNAIDALPSGGRINIATEDREGWVCLSVSDTGMGIEPAIRESIFEPTFTTKGQERMGLGLTIVLNIVQRHQGRIEVDSEVGKGSTFRVLLPVMAKSVEMPLTGGETYRDQKRGKILIIDDDLELLESLRLGLTQLGHDATCTANGTEGLSLVQRTKFDLVITDLGMPGMGGADIAICIKDINSDIPTLLITGWGIQMDSKQMELMKIEGVLHKPFTRAKLAETVNKLLK